MYEIKIGNVLKQVLRVQGKTLKKVSQDTGIPYSTLHTWYENRQPKDILRAQLLADYLGISLQKLLFDKLEFKESQGQASRAQSSEEFFKGTFEITVRKIE